MILDFLNDHMTTIALVLVGLAFLKAWLGRGAEEEDETPTGEPYEPPARRRWGEDGELHYRMEKDHFREDEPYDFVDDDEPG